MEAQQTTLSNFESELMQAIEAKNLDKFKQILNDNPKEDVNFVDPEKMTPLQQASYRGNPEMVKLVLERGADVNMCKHANDYTTLHFGALSGNVDVCHLLLAAGAKTNAINSINRTPAQLAAFVGHHNIVSTINNFIPKEDIDYYASIQGTQTTPYLDPKIVQSMYKFVLMYNMHPLKIAMLLNIYEGLVDNLDQVKKVLELMSDKEMKKRTNEVLGFKYYYLAYMCGEIAKLIKLQKEVSDEANSKSFVEVFAKKLLKVNKTGQHEYMETLIRQCVKSFPHIESTLFRQMVASLASDQSPMALSVVTAAVNGQRGFVDDTNSCSTCGEEKAIKKCSKCKSVSYCNKDCQKLHWFMHKKICSELEVRNLQEIKKQVNSNEISRDLQGLLAGQ